MKYNICSLRSIQCFPVFVKYFWHMTRRINAQVYLVYNIRSIQSKVVNRFWSYFWLIIFFQKIRRGLSVQAENNNTSTSNRKHAISNEENRTKYHILWFHLSLQTTCWHRKTVRTQINLLALYRLIIQCNVMWLVW